jgi:hypothetical protein
MGMSEDPLQKPTDFEKIKHQLIDMQQYLKEIKTYHCIDALLLAGLTTVMIQTFSFLLFGSLRTVFYKTLYMFCLLIGPSALFLLFLHGYDLYGFVKRGEKAVPLTLDFMYFLFLGFAFTTMIGLNSYYQHYQIPQGFLSPGWSVGLFLLCCEVLLALLCAQYIVRRIVSKRLPHFFDHRQKTRINQTWHHKKNIPKLQSKPSHVYYFKKKPDVTLWQDTEFFIRYKK